MASNGVKCFGRRQPVKLHPTELILGEILLSVRGEEQRWECRGASRIRAKELVALAIHLASHLDTSYYQREIVEDLRARAWSYMANLRRIASDFDGAEEAFQIAYAHLKSGTREPLER